MSDRRTLLRGLVALPFVAAPAAAISTRALPGSAEPIVALRRRFLAHMAVVDRYVASATVTPVEGTEADEAMNAASALEDEAEHAPATTLAGALAALEWGRDEFSNCYVQGRERPDIADVWTLTMLDKALGVLRQATTGGQA